MNLTEFSKEVHENAVKHGWWEEEKSFGEIIALCHAELSEALEEYRNEDVTKNAINIQGLPMLYYSGGGYIANGVTNVCKKPEGIAVELADCILRILDYCGKENIDIETILKIKHEYNKGRPYKHGGKKI